MWFFLLGFGWRMVNVGAGWESWSSPGGLRFWGGMVVLFALAQIALAGRKRTA